MSNFKDHGHYVEINPNPNISRDLGKIVRASKSYDTELFEITQDENGDTLIKVKESGLYRITDGIFEKVEE